MKKILVEFKARHGDLESARIRLREMNAKYIGAFRQVDTYFLVGGRRLKLREVENRDYAQLVYYVRENIKEPKVSRVTIARTPDPDSLKDILSMVLGVKVVVDKVREIYRYNGVQIHLDVVKGLGTFIEVEMEVESSKVEEGRAFLKEFMRKLGVDENNLIKGSYSDLLLNLNKRCFP